MHIKSGFELLSYVVALVLGYLFGSFPTAYLLVRWKSKIDIRKAGSGNVGTLNSYEVTRSKTVGILVLVVDFFKGILAVLFVRAAMGDEFAVAAASGIGAVLGHNFSFWLSMKGGRGLATAAGVMSVLGWGFVPLWMVVWFAGYKVSRDVNIGNAVATFFLLLTSLVAPAAILSVMIPYFAPIGEFRVFGSVLAVLILVRLVDPVREYLRQRRASA